MSFRFTEALRLEIRVTQRRMCRGQLPVQCDRTLEEPRPRFQLSGPHEALAGLEEQSQGLASAALAFDRRDEPVVRFNQSGIGHEQFAERLLGLLETTFLEHPIRGIHALTGVSRDRSEPSDEDEERPQQRSHESNPPRRGGAGTAASGRRCSGSSAGHGSNHSREAR